MSIEASPPAQPPQMSPDGKWVWDGANWQPVTSGEPSHVGVFAAYNSIQVEPADPVVPVQAAAPVLQAAPPAHVKYEPQYQIPAPMVDYSAAAPEVPLWERTPDTGISKYLYFGAALILMAMVLMVLNSLNYVSLPFIGSGSSNTSASPKPSPPGPVTRTEYARADAFLNGWLGPALTEFGKTLPAWDTCHGGTLSNACFDAINTSDQSLRKVLTVIDHGKIPPCIAAPMKKFRADIVGMDAGLQAAIKGFNDNQRPEVVTGLNQFAGPAQAFQADGTAVDNAWKAGCSKDLEGP